MVVRQERGSIIGGAATDLRRLHLYWMALLFPKVLQEHAVMGRWQPSTTGQRVAYYGWATVGTLALAVGYPLLVLGFATRLVARRLDSTGTRVGLLGVILITAVVWGGLTLLARLRFSAEGFLAVGAASIVAVVSAALAWAFVRLDGRPVTVALAYPAAMNAVFLPPVVAALYSPALAGWVLAGSDTLAIWLLDNVLVVGNLNDFFRNTFDLEGTAYVAMWFGIAVPLGWLLGGAVTLADAVRPKADDEDDAAPA